MSLCSLLLQKCQETEGPVQDWSGEGRAPDPAGQTGQQHGEVQNGHQAAEAGPEAAGKRGDGLQIAGDSEEPATKLLKHG